MSNLTTEEKIDYIYKQMKHQKIFGGIKTFIKLAILIFIAYNIYSFTQNTSKDAIIDTYTDKVSEAIAPMIGKMTEDMLKNIDTSEILNNVENTQDLKNMSKDELQNLLKEKLNK